MEFIFDEAGYKKFIPPKFFETKVLSRQVSNFEKTAKFSFLYEELISLEVIDVTRCKRFSFVKSIKEFFSASIFVY